MEWQSKQRLAKTIFFADDLIVLVEGKDCLLQVMSIIEQWALESGIKINKDKSALMQLKVGNRTPEPLEKQIRGFTMVKHYKFLGVLISNTFKFDADEEQREQMEKSLRKMTWILRDSKLSGT